MASEKYDFVGIEEVIDRKYIIIYNHVMSLEDEAVEENVPVNRGDEKKADRDDPLTYYRERYSGLTRYALRKSDPGLYQKLWKKGLLEEVPVKSESPCASPLR